MMTGLRSGSRVLEGNTQTINFVESITKQVADVEIKGSVTEKVYAAVDGNWFAMVSYEKGKYDRRSC